MLSVIRNMLLCYEFKTYISMYLLSSAFRRELLVSEIEHVLRIQLLRKPHSKQDQEQVNLPVTRTRQLNEVGNGSYASKV